MVGRDVLAPAAASPRAARGVFAPAEAPPVGREAVSRVGSLIPPTTLSCRSDGCQAVSGRTAPATPADIAIRARRGR
jgi:hypothetical protein